MWGFTPERSKRIELLAVGEEVGEILLDNMGEAVIAPSKLAEQVARTVMSGGDVCAFELGAAQGVPRVQAEVVTVVAEETCPGHVVYGGQAKPLRKGHARAQVGEGRDSELRVGPA